MDKKNLFYGTPLSKSLNDDQSNSDGSINSRKAWLTQQQTVRDDQGRQRFHGAFTGGFSAGYYNTVDTPQGFRPQNYVTSRRERSDIGRTHVFSHRPEDYMDEEDLGEFGIAPKKIRVNRQYLNAGLESSHISEDHSVKLSKLTIGEEILRNIIGDSRPGRLRYLRSSSGALLESKNDFHGLGYRPLKPSSTSHLQGLTHRPNPLTAILAGGKRLKISGEAFGVGVLNDEEDYMDSIEAYGYDDMRNYNFESKHPRNSKEPSNMKSIDDVFDQEPDQILGFTLAKKLSSIQLCDKIKAKCAQLIVPESWNMPERKEPYIPPSEVSLERKNIPWHGRQAASSFSNKFTFSGILLKASEIETGTGLVAYSELKAAELKVTTQPDQLDNPSSLETTISRNEVQWIPCSMLCKRFNVPNPFPNTSFVGTRLPNAPVDENLSRPEEKVEKVSDSTLELKRSIFNVTFLRKVSERQAEIGRMKVPNSDSESSDQDEDKPVVVDLTERATVEESEVDEPDIIEVAALKQEPEVISISSSSSSASSPPDTPHNHQGEADADGAYGPPLPPTLRTLIDTNPHGLHRSMSSKKKKKKRKKNKR